MPYFITDNWGPGKHNTFVSNLKEAVRPSRLRGAHAMARHTSTREINLNPKPSCDGGAHLDQGNDTRPLAGEGSVSPHT